MKKFAFTALLFTATLFATAQVNIIPKPVSLKVNTQSKNFNINTQTRIVIEKDSLRSAAVFFNDYLQKYLQYKLTITKVKPSENYISLTANTNISKFDHAYTLNSEANKISIVGKSNQGVFYGVQSLIQLLPTERASTLAIPAVNITDYPRFDYRGMHLDVSRHFFDVAFIKKYIDYLAYHKMNYFHWHLTDDHGWRIEIKKYPKLTEIGAWRNGSIVGLWPGKGNEGIKYKITPNDVTITPNNPIMKTDGVRHGGFYTQDEVREVVKYAAARYVNVIPEIEMPAHSMAVLAAYPEFGTEPNKKYEVAETWGMLNRFNNVLQPTEKTFGFLEDVLTEVMGLFPSQYIHIGGDEASKIWWKQSPESQKIIKEKGLKDEVALQSYIIHRIEKFVNSKGKTIIGWDEILDGGLAPNAIVMSWRGDKGGITAAKMGQKVVMASSAKLYFNHGQFAKEDSLTANRVITLATVYDYEPIPAELNAEQAKFVWGAQGNLWSEYVPNPSNAEYQIFPRLDALSETLWSPKAQKNYPDFLNRLKTQFKRYDLMGVSYSKRYLNSAP